MTKSAEPSEAHASESRGRASEPYGEAIAKDAGNWRRLAVVDGVPIYGDEDLWRFWQAQGFILWVKEGSRGDSSIPSPAELTRFVRASGVVPPPPG